MKFTEDTSAPVGECAKQRVIPVVIPGPAPATSGTPHEPPTWIVRNSKAPDGRVWSPASIEHIDSASPPTPAEPAPVGVAPPPAVGELVADGLASAAGRPLITRSPMIQARPAASPSTNTSAATNVLDCISSPKDCRSAACVPCSDSSLLIVITPHRTASSVMRRPHPGRYPG